MSIHARSDCSRAAQPAVLYPRDAQHAEEVIKLLADCLTMNNKRGNVPKTVDMAVMHGFPSFFDVGLVRSAFSGGSRMGAVFGEGISDKVYAQPDSKNCWSW